MALRLTMSSDWEVVLPDGEIVELGGTVEETAGYDLRGVMIGSEGTFGIVTKAIVRLTRNPQAYQTALAVFETNGRCFKRGFNNYR